MKIFAKTGRTRVIDEIALRVLCESQRQRMISEFFVVVFFLSVQLASDVFQLKLFHKITRNPARNSRMFRKHVFNIPCADHYRRVQE